MSMGRNERKRREAHDLAIALRFFFIFTLLTVGSVVGFISDLPVLMWASLGGFGFATLYFLKWYMRLLASEERLGGKFGGPYVYQNDDYAGRW